MKQFIEAKDVRKRFGRKVALDGITFEIDAPGITVVLGPNGAGKSTLLRALAGLLPADAGRVESAGDAIVTMVFQHPIALAGSVADGEHPVALTGRVYCWADASHGPIQPGDLLTTSDVPGHAMRVTDDPARANGAILGKAMTSLSEGKGLVLVLVSLQ